MTRCESKFVPWTRFLGGVVSAGAGEISLHGGKQSNDAREPRGCFFFLFAQRSKKTEAGESGGRGWNRRWYLGSLAQEEEEFKERSSLVKQGREGGGDLLWGVEVEGSG